MSMCFYDKARPGFLIAVLLSGIFAVSASGTDADRLRALGNAALRARDYDRAVKFYQRYRDAAAGEGGDRKSLQDAYIRLIAAHVSASQIPEAKRELAAFTKTFPFADKKLIVLYQSSILMLERKYKEAENLIYSILKDKINQGDLYFQLLSNLGLSLRRQERWTDAANIYDLLGRQAKGSSWEFIAFQQRLYCLIMGEELIKSKKLFEESEKFKNEPGYKELKLLLLLQMLKEKRFSELRQTYTAVISEIPAGPNPLIYKITRIAIKHFFNNDKPADAIIFLQDAFKFAPDENERKNSLLLLVNTYVRTGHNNEAIKAALKYIDFYYSDPRTIDVQIQCARLMAAEKMYSEALAVYTALLKEPRLSPAQRIIAAREAAVLYELNGSPNKASRMLEIVYKSGSTDAERMEGKYLQGQLFYKNKAFAEAAAAFEEVMVQKSPWQIRGAYWALQSQLRLKNYSKALHIAKELTAYSEDKLFAAAGSYFLAFCQEQLGNTEGALREYRNYIKQYPQGSYVPEATLAAGKILFARKNFVEALELFKDFPAQHPKNEYTPNILYKTVFVYYQLQKWDEMETTVRMLAREYPESDYAVAAEFWLIDCLRNQGKYLQAGELAASMLKKYQGKPEIAGQLLYDLALIAYHTRKSGEALKNLEELFKGYPEHRITAKALLLAGDITSAEGDYETAGKYYRRAAKLRPESDFETACLGRVADCDYSLYNQTLDLKLLQRAAGTYKKLLEIGKLPLPVRNQTKYKLGRCYELLKNEDEALNLYNELLYGYQVDQGQGINYKPVWVVKAARAAIMMYLKMDTPEAAGEAVRVYRILKKMDLKTGEDFDAYIKNIQAKYSLDGESKKPETGK
ncbi:MAG: tetratricopeptide repeat protein [Victivallales bacterium]|nr:tetratricopeptide repeat protein [Victivallales bacterium]